MSTPTPRPIPTAKDLTLFKTHYPRQDPNFSWVDVRDGDPSVKWRRDPADEIVFEAFDLAGNPEERLRSLGYIE